MRVHQQRRALIEAVRFLRADDGVLPILALVFFIMLMAVGGLAIDLGRLYGERGQMQTYVDNVAISAASQLDGQSDAIARAYKAAKGGPLITGTGMQSIATVSGLDVQQLTFLDVLGPDPGPTGATPATGDDVICTWTGGTWAPANCNTSSTISKAARFVEVRSAQRTVAYYILPLVDIIGKLFGASAMVNHQGIALRATAGYKSEVCDINPLMVCNPSEPANNSNANYPFSFDRGEQVLMKEKGNNSAWGPGDFGLVDVPSDAGNNGECNGNGASRVRCILALVNPLTHCLASTVGNLSTAPGQESATSDGIKVRFDIYEGNLQSKNTDANFKPSVNVTKGVCKKTGNGNGASCTYSGNNACPNLNQENLDPATGNGSKQLVRLPRDTSWDASGRFGTAWAGGVPTAAMQTALNNYWTKNHGGTLPASLTGKTRYDIYRYEIANAIPNKSGAGGEDGNPRCASSGVNNASRDRRTLVMAVIDCHAFPPSGKSNVPVVAYVKMFITEPPGLGATGAPVSNVNDIYGEIIGTVKPGDTTGTLHVLPVLYR